MKVVIAGGTGSLGSRLADHLIGRGHEVVILTRSPDPAASHRQVRWDGKTVGAWASELDGAIVINLAGALVDRRPTAANIELLTTSRTQPTTALVDAAANLDQPVPLWLQMSTLAIYGDGGDTTIDEGTPPASEPPQMTSVARAWEHAATDANTARKVTMRTGIVLDAGTPALDRLTTITRWGLGGRISTGKQWISWLHIDDFVAAIDFLIHRPIDGVVHLTAPNPITNADMMATLRHTLHRPWAPPTPKPLVHLGACLMRTDPALALTGRRCIPRRLLEDGFEFAHPNFAEALDACLAENESADHTSTATERSSSP